MRSIIIFVLLLLPGIQVFSQKTDHLKELNIPYYSDSINQSDKNIKEKCLLDIYYPVNTKNFATIIWIHGGGLVGGDKTLPKALLRPGICVVTINYRLRVKCPKYLEDAATAVAWVFNNIKRYGGDPDLVFVAGHSAGAYLTAMIGLDKKWLAAYNIDANRIAGLFPLSSNGITHKAIKHEKGVKSIIPWIDEYAPLFHVRADAPPLILMTGDRELEMVGRYEENAYLARMMKLAGHKETILYEFEGYGHGMTTPGFPLVSKWVDIITKRIKETQK